MHYPSKTKKAFTLIEIMIVIAIIGIMAIAALSLISSSQRAAKDVELEARNVASVIASVQNDALSGRNAGTPANCTYQFPAVTNVSTYTTGTAGVLVNTFLPCTPRSYKTTNGVTITNLTAFSFSSPFGKMRPLGTKTITLTRSGKTYKVCVYDSGKILESAAASCP